MDEEQNAPEKSKQPQELEKELEATRNQLLRLQADFENARKRFLKAQAESQELANADLLRQLLEIYDDFQRALQAGGQADLFRAGIEMIAKRMEIFLASYGVAPIQARGQLFDPERHEAVAHEVNEKVPESTVLEELRKGYMMNGRTLRTAVVKVAVKPEHSVSDSKKEEELDLAC